ncbi:uncharacterized protein [Periplaneta americana]|uniref:uncharacterized protein n=1 Tax=Periplaneta americana TaxID=6978 RepID=UPI0037E7EE97
MKIRCPFNELRTIEYTEQKSLSTFYHWFNNVSVKPTEPTMNPDNMKQLIRETVDHKALKVEVNKMKKLSNNTLFVECNNSTDCDTLEKKLTKINALSIERPKKKLPAILLKFVPRHIDDAEVKDLILQQNNLTHLENPVIDIKFTKAKFEDSRHLVMQVSPNIRRELLALQRIKLKWSMCRVEDFTIITRCLKCLRYGHTSKYCNNKQTCSYCAEEHSWKDQILQNCVQRCNASNSRDYADRASPASE